MKRMHILLGLGAMLALGACSSGASILERQTGNSVSEDTRAAQRAAEADAEAKGSETGGTAATSRTK